MKNRFLSGFLGLLIATTLFFLPSAMGQSATGAVASGADAPDYSLNLELTVTEGVVTGITLYNADGETLFANADLTGTTPEEALAAALAQIDESGYLTPGDEDGYLLITTSGGIPEAAEAAALRAIAKDYLKSLGRDYEVDSASLGADVIAKASTLGLPGGRYLMMEYIAAQQGITVEEAVALYGNEKVQTLMNTFEGLREAMSEDGEQEKTQEQLELEAQQREAAKEQRKEDKETDKETKKSNSDKPANSSSGSTGKSGGSQNSNNGNKSGGKK